MLQNIDDKQILIMHRKNNATVFDDITRQISGCEETKNSYCVKYNSGSCYHISKNNFKIYQNAKCINNQGNVVWCKGKLLVNVAQIYKFDNLIKIFYDNGGTGTYQIQDIVIGKDITNDSVINDYLKYVQNVAKVIGNTEKDFLCNQLENICVLENSVLGKLLTGQFSAKTDNSQLIYPFAFNKKQKLAVERAMEQDCSIIQGPPGTGKTQTILNIVANYVNRGQRVAVVSGNNEATKNVEEKLDKEGYGAINAVLGNRDNVIDFFSNKDKAIHSPSKDELKFNETQTINFLLKQMDVCLEKEEQIAIIRQAKVELGIENGINSAEKKIIEANVPKNIKKLNYTSRKFLELASILEVQSEEKIKGFFNRARLLFRYGIIRVKYIAENKNDSINYLKSRYYAVKENELQADIEALEYYLKSNNSKELKSKYIAISKKIFQKEVNKIVAANSNNFNIHNYRYKFDDFTKRYPVIYSTTHALAACSAKKYLYDCVIIDESSQVDLVTATIAFSMAKRVVLVGDDKQIPNVIKSVYMQKLERLFEESSLDDCFNYAKNNILNCIQKKFGDNIVSTLLEEHYRCDPQIISFCNKRFYNNKLIIQTTHKEGQGVEFIKNKGYHQDGLKNERQIEIIDKEIIPKVTGMDIGITAPYNEQINALKLRFESSGYKIETVHKFQGRDNDVIILSTVANRIKIYEDNDKNDFINDPNLLNVAISRAKKKLYVIVSEDILKQENAILKDFENYCNYYCDGTVVSDTNVYSVFDLLYKDYHPILESTKAKLLKISEFNSENIIATVINDIIIKNKNTPLSFVHNYPLSDVIKISSLTDVDDIKFVSNAWTHCDFVIFSTMNKEIKLIIEVDGKQHREEKQANRDMRKDRLIREAGLKILRLPTTSIDCEEQIVEALGIKL